nr:hypothetical protein Iba_chr03bCG1940 [Ipomoea batatas]
MGCEEVSFHLPPEEPPPVMLDHNEPSNDDINGHKPLSRSATDTGYSIDDASVEATQQSTRSIQLRRSSRQRQYLSQQRLEPTPFHMGVYTGCRLTTRPLACWVLFIHILGVKPCKEEESYTASY